MNFKGAIFDLDGTLLDSMGLWDSIGEVFLKTKGITPPPNLNNILKPMSLVQSAQYLHNTYYLSDTEEQIIYQIDSLIERQYQLKIPLKKHAAFFLQTLNKEHVKMCIATATNRPLVEAALIRLGIAQYFDFILTCAETGTGKDNPKIYENALKCLGTKKQSTIVFEDSLHAIQTAKSAEFFVAGVYDSSSFEDSIKIKSIADWYISSYEKNDITNFLNNI